MKGTTILLVEDTADDEHLIKRLLAKINLLNNLVVVRDGAEALDYLFGAGAYAKRDATQMPAVVFLDLKLPKVSGLEVLRHIRADERTKLLPVVILSSSQEEQDLFQSYSLGANSYIRKPVDYTEFTEAVQQMGFYWLLLNELPLPKRTP
ncbi:MAG: response regulator [Verrucomicrobia bacterium]|nr:response regulator [Verrucomicrobiota bacterium]